jgi:hypothetical protein
MTTAASTSSSAFSGGGGGRLNMGGWGELLQGGGAAAVHVSTFAILLSTAVLATAWWVLLHRLKQRHYKGPKSWPLLGCLLEQAAHFDDMHDWLLDYFKDLLTYSVPMVNFNNTFTVDPANVEWILKTNFNNYPKVPALILQHIHALPSVPIPFSLFTGAQYLTLQIKFG